MGNAKYPLRYIVNLPSFGKRTSDPTQKLTMPGVPSGKGCDACVKQKKKCDQLKPACSRCARLQITCTGSGKQRYKFKQVRAGPVPGAGARRSESHSSRTSSVRSLSRTPSNDATMMLSDFVDKLEVKDIRFDLCWAYGNLLREIPKRLGTNIALDAAVNAITTTASDLSLGYKSPEALVRYGHALTALRTCLDDPVSSQSSSTLCAIYLIWICQTWIGIEPEYNCGHGSGIVQILANAPYRDSKDPFDTMLLMTLSGPVIFESIFNPEVQLNPWVKEWVMEQEKPLIENAETTKDTGQPQAGRIMSCLVRLPEFMRYNPDTIWELRQNYQAVQATSKVMRERLSEAATAMKSGVPAAPPFKNPRAMIRVAPMRIHAFYQRTFSILLALEIILNGLLRAYSPEDYVLEVENDQLTREIIDLSLEGSIWKPIGAGWVPVCLISAWGATMDPARKTQIEKVWDESWAEISHHSLPFAASSIGDTFVQLRLAAFRGKSMSPYRVPSPYGIPTTTAL